MEFIDNTFVYWAVNRESIRQKREAGLPREEWTKDPILRNYSFCNVSREDDRTTVWIKDNIRDPWDAAGSHEELFRAVALSRFFNLPSSLGMMLAEGVLSPDKKIDLHAVHDCLQSHKDADSKNRVFAAAYMVGAPDNFRTYEFGQEKIAYVCGVLNHAKLPEHRATRQGFVEELNKQFGFSDFMSGQVAADLAYTSILRDASDHMTWAPRGPGAMRGMNRAVGQPVKRKIPVAEYLEIGRAQLAALPKDLVEDRGITLHDVASNINCETSKYLKARIDGVMPKRKFHNGASK